MNLIDGKKIAAELRNELKIEVDDIKKKFIPNLGLIDISPIVLLLSLWFVKLCLQLYIRPMIFL